MTGIVSGDENCHPDVTRIATVAPGQQWATWGYVGVGVVGVWITPQV